MKVSINQFGKNHWSLLAYIECRCVNHNGKLDHTHMRCNEMTHLEFRTPNHPEWEVEDGTKLKGFDKNKVDTNKFLIFHDDWNCLEDLEKEGFVKILSLKEGIVKLMKKGLRESANLRHHKVSGGCFANYEGVR